jgi:hypothetical protein
MRESFRKGPLGRLMVLATVCTALLFNATAVQALGPLTMYTPSANALSYGSLSPRVVQLNYNGTNNNKMYASFEQTTTGVPVFPIYESLNNGATWTQVGSVQDTQNGWGMLNCPQLFELPQAFGNMPAGTLIMAGNSVPSDKSATKMELYKSNDLGRTWTYVSTIATGGRNEMGYDPIWEPFIMVYNNKLIVYYSDERDPAHAQKLVHQTTTDGVTWGPVVDDVAFAEVGLRPGMPTIAKMGNGNFAMTYEMPTLSGAPNYIKISSNPESWNPTDRGAIIGYGGSPYIAALGDGRIVLNVAAKKEVLVNASRVDVSGNWVPYDPPVTSGYNRQLLPLNNGRLFIPQAGFFDPNNKNSINYGDMSVGYFKLINTKSGQALGVSGGATTDGSQLVQWSNDTNSLDQYWLVTDAGGGLKEIVNAKSKKSLGVLAGATTDGASAVIWTSNSASDQKWLLTASGSNYKITNNKSNKVLAVSGGSTATGANVVQTSDTGTADQQWQLVPDSGQIIADSYRFVNVKSGKNLGIYQGSGANGANAVQWTGGNLSYDQNWLLIDTGSGNKKFITANSRKALGILSASTTSGAQAVQWNDNGSTDQQWVMVAIGNNYVIKNLKSGLYLSVSQGLTTDGANVIQSTYTGTSEQQWQLVKNK